MVEYGRPQIVLPVAVFFFLHFTLNSKFSIVYINTAYVNGQVLINPYSGGTVCRRQFLTYKNGPCAKRI